ncbi:MAG: metal-dependent hydrolase [Microcystaceae cyanobacterium]
MMTITHLLTSSVATGAILGTTQPEIILTGAIAGLLPDIDISTSPIGRILTPISRFLETRLAHRSATHSLIASGLLAVISYGLALKFSLNINFIHALNIGYFAGWFLDCFTKSGVEMFYPMPIRCVCPGNRNLRISTGSPPEYWLVTFLVAIALWLFQVNDSGGLIKEFNRLIAAPSGVLELYNEQGGDHLIYANVQGVYRSDRSPVKGKYPILGVVGNDFIVATDSEIHKAGNDSDSTIITQRITGEVGESALIQTQAIAFVEDDLSKLQNFDQGYLSGTVQIDDPESLQFLPHPREYPTVSLSGSTVTLSYAPLATVKTLLADQLITGTLSLKVIHVQ